MRSFKCGLTAVLLFAAGTALAGQNVLLQVQDAEKLMSSGDVASAVSALEKIVASAPRSYDARLILGRALDLQGKHDAARKHLEEALKLAQVDEERVTALTTLGISYAFESKPNEAARYYQRAFDAQIQADDRAAAAGLANALGRIYLESGNLPKAEQWYKTGFETSKKIQAITPTESALWEMRWHNALGRIAARRGNKAAAEEHAAATKTLLDKNGNDNQRAFYPYLVGYIAFYSKDYRRAVDELMKGDQNDPFVLGLIAQAHEKLGEREAAAEYYRKVMGIATHSINSAFARPRARAFLR